MPATSHTPRVRPSRTPSNPHYDPSKKGNAWDGQLSAAGIIEIPQEQWPTIIERDSFVDVATATLKLDSTTSSVLRRVVFRSGPQTQACWESQESMGKYLGCSRRTIQRALQKLLDLDLIYQVNTFHGTGQSNCYVPRLRLSHLRHPDTNEDKAICDTLTQMDEDWPPICDTVAPHLRHPDALTERTEILTDSHVSDMTEEHLINDLALQNMCQSPFICDTESQMERAPSVDVPDCTAGCGQPWTTPEKHLSALARSKQFGIKPEFLCADCWQKQVDASSASVKIQLSEVHRAVHSADQVQML